MAPSSNPAASLLITAVVVATAVVIVTPSVRPPTPAESAAYLVVTAASYLVCDLLPPALAILYGVIAIKAFPHAAPEHFSVAAPHWNGRPDDDVPAGASEHQAAGARLNEKKWHDVPRIALATPEALHAAQNCDVPHS